MIEEILLKQHECNLTKGGSLTKWKGETGRKLFMRHNEVERNKKRLRGWVTGQTENGSITETRTG